MDNASTRAQLLEHFLSFFMPKGILDFFELVWAESQSLDSRESKKDILYTRDKKLTLHNVLYLLGREQFCNDLVAGDARCFVSYFPMQEI